MLGIITLVHTKYYILKMVEDALCIENITGGDGGADADARDGG